MTEKNKNYYAIIMAGGIGTRFWPSSRSSYPKQFLDILGTGKSLLQITYERFLRNFDPENIYIVTNQAYVGLVREQLVDIPEACILAEPIAKNTAACIAFASSKIQSVNTHATCVVAPSDHLILDEQTFMKDVFLALQYAQKNDALLTLGIRPSRPDTGYGYIQFIESEDPGSRVHKVKTFTEKPSADLARTFVDSGDFLWNGGIFIWSGSAIRSAFKEHLSDHWALFHEASKSYGTKNEAAAVQNVYEQCRAISIDYGVLEKASNVYVIPSEFGWSDLGTWTSLYENSEKDKQGNVVKGKNVLMYEVANTIVSATAKNSNRLIVVKNVSDLIIVDTPDVLLICDKNKEQEVKQVVTDIKLRFDEKFT